MKLHHKTFLMLFVVITLIIGFISYIFSRQNEDLLEEQFMNAAVDMSQTIAAIPTVQQYLGLNIKDNTIQDLVLPLMTETRYQYIIVMDMEGIQYSYPYESGLFKPYKNGGEEDVLQKGLSYSSFDNNAIISGVRSFFPVFYRGEQVGAVLVGLLTTTGKEESLKHIQIMEYTMILGIIFGMAISILFSYNIRKSTMGLEPRDIAILAAEKDLIFQNIERGILVVDNSGTITMCNKKALNLLSLESAEKETIKEISPYLSELLDTAKESGIEHHHQRCKLENDKNVLLQICPVLDYDHNVKGQVLGMEDMTAARILAEELTDYRSLVDSLRAQNHEFMNRLQTISGLIQLGHYDRALDFIEGQIHQNQSITRFLSEQIKENNLAALLLVKYEQASERKINFFFDDECSVKSLPSTVNSEEVCTMIGNLLENSMEAVKETENPFISLYVFSDSDHLDIEISNNGPSLEIPNDELIKKGYSTKGEGRGYGLYLINAIVAKARGEFYWINEEVVTWHVKI